MATLNHQVWINAPAVKVYDAVATLAGITSWWGPHERSEIGGSVVFSHNPGPVHGEVKFKVLDSTPNQRVEWEFFSTHPAASPASAWTGTHVVFEISERDNKPYMSGIDAIQKRVTVLEFRHTGWNEHSEYFGFCNFAWGLTLKNLKDICEAHKT